MRQLSGTIRLMVTPLRHDNIREILLGHIGRLSSQRGSPTELGLLDKVTYLCVFLRHFGFFSYAKEHVAILSERFAPQPTNRHYRSLLAYQNNYVFK